MHLHAVKYGEMQTKYLAGASESKKTWRNRLTEKKPLEDIMPCMQMALILSRAVLSMKALCSSAVIFDNAAVRRSSTMQVQKRSSWPAINVATAVIVEL